MLRILRRLRGILVTGLLWSLAWGIAGGLVYTALAILNPPPPQLGHSPLRAFPATAPFFAVWGALIGVVFAGVLILAERRTRLADLSRRRVALWGAAAGAFWPSLTGVEALLTGRPAPADLVPSGLAFAAVGALVAAGHLALAQRGSTADATTVANDTAPAALGSAVPDVSAAEARRREMERLR